jgi:hypothetical protein
MPWNQALDFNQDFGSGMKSLVLRLFWRIVLPFVLALVIAVSEMMELLGRRRGVADVAQAARKASCGRKSCS